MTTSESLYSDLQNVSADFCRVAADLSAAFQKAGILSSDFAQALTTISKEFPKQKSPRRTRLVTRIKRR